MDQQGVEIVRELPIQDVLKQPEQRTRLFKILIQTLSNIGLKEAAKLLQQESQTQYFDPTLEALETSLDEKVRIGEEQTALIGKLINDKDAKTQDRIRLALLELTLSQIAKDEQQPSCGVEQNKPVAPVQNRRQQEMLSRLEFCVAEHGFSSGDSMQKLNELTTQLVFQPQHFLKVDGKKLLRQVVDLSDSSGIERHSMQRIIKFYAESNFGKRNDEARGQDFYDLQRFSMLENSRPSVAELPRKQLITHDHETKYEIAQMAVNKDGTIVATAGVNVSLQESEICLWNLRDVNFKPNGTGSDQKEELFSETVTDTLKQIATCLAWNHETTANEIILAVASRASVTLFNRKLKKIVVLGEIDALCCKFNPITNFLYTGGLNNHQLRVWDSRGEQLDTYRTGPIRDIVFSLDGTHMYLVSSSSYQLTKMDTVQAEKLLQLSIVNPILDCTPTSQSELLLCSRDKLYVLKESSLQILRCYELDGVTGDIQYYSYVREWGSWIIVSGERNFRAIAAHGKSQVVKWRHHTSYPAFDSGSIGGRLGLVSSKGKRLCFWSAEPESGADEEHTEARMEEEDSDVHLHSQLEQQSFDQDMESSEEI